ncbi:DUF6332 family protein [Streptomyces sp. NPDC002553]|uniref:DUF6332 family protein n=1 Tax=Streptomyces sp. NPDC002553 TaxID=3154417 RepID=UPI00331C3E09
MSEYGGRRRQARRDAVTVEIGYALFSAAFAAAVIFGAVAGPALLFRLPSGIEVLLIRTGYVLAPLVFAARVVSVLVGFRPDASRPSGAHPDSRCGAHPDA